MEFQAGDIVQLKSGGPAMTVANVDEAGVHCVWYGEVNDEIRNGVIAAIVLEAVTPIEDDEDEHEDEDEHHGHKKKKHGHDD